MTCVSAAFLLVYAVVAHCRRHAPSRSGAGCSCPIFVPSREVLASSRKPSRRNNRVSSLVERLFGSAARRCRDVSSVCMLSAFPVSFTAYTVTIPFLCAYSHLALAISTLLRVSLSLSPILILLSSTGRRQTANRRPSLRRRARSFHAIITNAGVKTQVVIFVAGQSKDIVYPPRIGGVVEEQPYVSRERSLGT